MQLNSHGALRRLHQLSPSAGWQLAPTCADDEGGQWHGHPGPAGLGHSGWEPVLAGDVCSVVCVALVAALRR